MISTSKYKDTTIIFGFGRPFGLNTDENSDLYVTDMDLHAIIKLSSNLEKHYYFNPTLESWQPSINKSNYFNGPHSIAFDKDQNFYITTYYTPLIYVFNQAGKFLNVIGDIDSKYQLAGPATAFVANNRLYVSEYANNEIVCYTLQGGYVKSFKGFDRPHMIKLAPDGYFYCADTWNHRIKKLDLNGEITDAWGVQGLENPFTPVSINFSNQHLIISDWANNRVNLFTLEGELVFSTKHLALNHPYDAIIWNNQLVIADSHHSRVVITEVEL